MQRTYYFTFNFLMEDKSRARGNLHSQEEQEVCVGSENSVSAVMERGFRKLKKDTLKEKKRLKAIDGKLTQSDDIETDNISNKHKEDEGGSVSSQDSLSRQLQISKAITENAGSLLGKLLIKPSYIAFANSNRVVGSFGHGSILFKRPIVEGSYFMEFTVKEDGKKEKNTIYPSAVRVGLCIYNFDTAYPLGCNESVAYKSADGSIIRQNECIGKGESYGVGDVIGVCMRIHPPKKQPNPQLVNEGSSVQFYKNGKLMFEFKELRQVFYCFGVSIYNYGQIQINTKQAGLFKIERAQHYFASFYQKIIYRDLTGNRLFKM